MFSNNSINIPHLRQYAWNLRWAEVPDGVIPLTAADPDFPVAPEIINAIKRFSSKGYFSYTPPAGLPEFTEALSDWLKTKRGIHAPAGYILPTDSAAAAIDTVCASVLNPGDEVLIFNPSDFLFRHCTERNLGVPVMVPVSDNPDDVFDAEKLSYLITGKTRMIALCNPLNPVGKVFTAIELTGIAKIAKENNLIILSDEIWSDIVFQPSEFCSIASISADAASRTYTVGGFSKSYGLAGLRVGYIVAPREEEMHKILVRSGSESTVHGCNVLGQIAGAIALKEGGYWLSAFHTHLTAMRNLVCDRLNDMPGVSCYKPQGCYLAFPDIHETGFTSEELCKQLKEKASVALVPGLPRWFGSGSEGHVRICFATSEEILHTALDRIDKFLRKQ